MYITGSLLWKERRYKHISLHIFIHHSWGPHLLSTHCNEGVGHEHLLTSSCCWGRPAGRQGEVQGQYLLALEEALNQQWAWGLHALLRSSAGSAQVLYTCPQKSLAHSGDPVQCLSSVTSLYSLLSFLSIPILLP